ncbi:MAG: hypothetical protein O2909_01425 [Chloroflexi bacterium]|nr:hypothetical protein [Chloroflexota bacterium]PKB57911.1 MAG: hypothetical protein BZY73_00735 [SAR202 cluster bacterium Casp-Chloro-G3]
MTMPYSDLSPQNGNSPQYFISFERLTQLGRSPIHMLASRRGPSAPSRVKPDHELDNPAELVEEIAEYGVKETDYIRSSMPLQEIVFRILLGRRNEPTSLRDLHYELTEKWSTPMRPINITEEGLERILDGDTFYGFDHKHEPGDEN